MFEKSFVLTSLAAGAFALVASCSRPATPAAPKAPPTAHTPAPAPAVLSDSTIEEHVQKAIQADASLSPQARAVSVSVHEGTVTLRGKVADEVEKSNLNALASNIPGVRRVDNQLEIGTG